MAVSERPLFRKALGLVRKAQASEERRTMDRVTHPLFKLSPEGNILYANKKAQKQFGIPHSEFVGKHITEFVEHARDGEDKNFLDEAFRKAKSLEEGKSDETSPALVLRKHGGEKVESMMRFSFNRPFGRKDPHIYASVSHTAPVLEKSRLLRDMFDIADTINKPEDIDVILQNIADEFSKKFNAACIVAKPNNSPNLHLAGFAGTGILPAHFAKLGEIPFGVGLLGKVAVSKSIINVPNIQEWEGSYASEVDKRYDFRHAIGIPLTVKGSNGEPILVGVIGMYKHGAHAKERFKPWEEEILTVLSQNTASVIQNAHLTQEIKRQAERVSLTGLYNRGYLFKTIRNYLSPIEQGKEFKPAIEGKQFGVIYADANNLKLLNDLHSHDQGNKGLKTLGSLLSQHSPKKALVSQVGGDEFAIFVPDATPEETKELAEKLSRTVREEMKKDSIFGSPEVNFGATFGHMHFAPGAQNVNNTRNLTDIHAKHAEHEDHYLDAIVDAAEQRMKEGKASEKRATGYIDRGFFLTLARHVTEGKVNKQEERKFLLLLKNHVGPEAFKLYAGMKHRLRGEKK